MINSDAENNVAIIFNRPKNIIRVITDFVCVGLIILPIILLKTIATPFKRGFYCNDESLNYPFYSSTITNYLLYAFGFIVPTIAMICMELVNSLLPYRSSLSRETVLGKLQTTSLYLYKIIGWFIFGAFVSMLITDIGKYTIGRLRPHFFDICRPAINMGPSTCLNNPMFLMPNSLDCRNSIYYSDYVCCGGDEALNNEVKLSFPSGHSSFSFYTMIFLVLFLQQRFIYPPSTLFKPLCQALAFICAFFTALSRVMNNKHHPTDVLTGALIGTLTAIILVKFFRPFESLKIKPNLNGNIRQSEETEVKLKEADLEQGQNL